MPLETSPPSSDPQPKDRTTMDFLVVSRKQEETKGQGLRSWSRVLSGFRLAVFVLFLAGLWLVFGSPGWPWLALVPVGVVFFGLLFVHEVLHRRMLGNQFRLALHDWSLARLDNRWQGKGIGGGDLVSQDHPYAADLDIVGVGSLFESLCIARTRLGQKMLAQWLVAPGSPAHLKPRQDSVRELAGNWDSRLDLVEKSGAWQVGQDLDSTLVWADSSLRGPAGFWVAIGLALGAANLVTLIQWISGQADSLGVACCGLLTVLLYGLTWKKIRTVLHGLEKQAEALLAARGGLESMASQNEWKSERLVSLRLELMASSKRPNAQAAVDRLVTLVQTWQAKRNPLITVPLVLLFWDLVFSWLLLRWHRANAGSLKIWLGALAEYEALQSLAHHSFLFPGDIFPTLIESGPSCFEARDLGHPLLPLARCVRNQVDLAPPRQLLLVSGSNMSGKSTYLRSAGVAAVLAWAGGPVRASQMRISRFQVAAILHAEDSLRLGMSRFAAELARMRRLIELSKGEIPLLFLLDEIFSGTNSSDRLAGAEALIRRLVQTSAVGMVTTHDLTLAKIADDLGDKGANVHFVDNWSGGMMSFDYRLQPGVVPRSNALGLMRAIGLDL